MIHGIIFSCNRAPQLRLLLESLKKNALGVYGLTVSYNWTNDEFRKGYEKLMGEIEFVGLVKWVSQQEIIGKPEYKNHLLGLISETFAYTSFFCDDDIMFGKVNQSIIYDQMGNEEVFCFSPRLGLNTTWHWNTEKRCDLKSYESFHNCIRWDWTQESCHYGYPLSIDGHIFRTSEIKNLVERIDCISPNRLEAHLQALKPTLDKRKMASFKQSVLVGTPINIVQKESPTNKCGRLFPVDTARMNELYLGGRIIDLGATGKRCSNWKNIKSTHKEIRLILKNE